jgi:hypothetical protein
MVAVSAINSTKKELDVVCKINIDCKQLFKLQSCSKIRQLTIHADKAGRYSLKVPACLREALSNTH